MITQIRCSKLHRPMTCPGYVFMDLPKQETGPAAMEGTAFGELCEQMIKQKTITPQVGSNASNGIFWDADAWFYAKQCVSEVTSCATSEISTEYRIDWMTESGIEITGTLDVCYTMGDVLCVDDFKYGWKIVEAKENWQLLGYVIGLWLKAKQNGTNFEKFRVRIIQPRPHHEDGWVREWWLTPGDVLIYKREIEDRMMQISKGVKQLNTGPQCKYCEAAAESCPAMNRAFYAAVDYTMDTFEQDTLSEEDIAAQVKLIKRIEDIVKIKSDSLTELARQRINQGKLIPGYVIEQSYGHRQWQNWVTPEALEAMTGKNLRVTEMLSPAKAEKLGIPRSVVTQLTSKPFSGNKLVAKDGTDVGNKIFGTEAPK